MMINPQILEISLYVSLCHDNQALYADLGY